MTGSSRTRSGTHGSVPVVDRAAALSDGSDVTRERVDAVLRVMRGNGAVPGDLHAVELEQLQGGFSRQIYRVVFASPNSEPKAVIVRVHQPGSLVEAGLGAEYRTYEALTGVGVPTPHLYGYEDDTDTPFGGGFFVMECLPGWPPNVWRSADRDLLRADWEGPRRIADDLVRYLATIHTGDTSPVQRVVPHLGFTELVGRWQQLWERARLSRDPVVEDAYAWVLDQHPDPVPASLVHGDFRIGNCLVGDGVTGILDWEFTHVGDPRFDLGYLALEYNCGKFLSPGSDLLGAVAGRSWFWERYHELTGMVVDLEVVRTFSVVGALMLIANLTAGVRSYVDGQATDIRMLWGRLPVAGLRQDLVRLMRWPTASDQAPALRT